MDTSRLVEIARQHYITAVESDCGPDGLDIVRSLFTRVKEVHSVLDYESITGALTVFQSGDESHEDCLGEPHRLFGVNEVPLHNKGTLTIQVLDNDRIHLWTSDTLPIDLPEDAIAYRYEPGKSEKVWVRRQERSAALTGFPRLFSTPAFLDLEEALNHYRIHLARPTECPYLSKAWREEGRVMWRAKPEEYMRLSLYHFLRGSLRNGRPDVNQEAPVDDRNPVDITVRWAGSNRIALIEVKWIGKSGTVNPNTFKTAFSEKAARDGLNQLAAYLDLTRERAGLYDRRGYLAVFDGRRKGVKVDDEKCERENGFAYAEAHIQYDQDLLDRHDVATPLRFFCEPKLVFSSPSRKNR